MPLPYTAETLMSYLENVFPQIRGEFAIEALQEGHIEVRLKVQAAAEFCRHRQAIPAQSFSG